MSDEPKIFIGKPGAIADPSAPTVAEINAMQESKGLTFEGFQRGPTVGEVEALSKVIDEAHAKLVSHGMRAYTSAEFALELLSTHFEVLKSVTARLPKTCSKKNLGQEPCDDAFQSSVDPECPIHGYL